MIEIKNVSYKYSTPAGSVHALKSITTSIPSGAVTAIIGHTGSGKSTLMELLAGLIKPDCGAITADGKEMSPKTAGLVFQYPEYQLFAETVYDDIAFGPLNSGSSKAEADERVKYAANKMRIDSDMMKYSPFTLSGGQKRLAAIAGILAMKRDILLLDEPAAGLDPSGRQLVFSVISELIEENKNMTVVFVTHSMEDAAEFADNILVLDSGELIMQGAPDEVFSNKEQLISCGLDIPEMMKLSIALCERGIDIGTPLSVSDAYRNIMRLLK